MVEKCVCVTVKETALSFLITDNKSLRRHLSQAGPYSERDFQIGFFIAFFPTVAYSLALVFPPLYENGSSIPVFVILYASSTSIPL